jgi:hypothetical protein
MKILQNSTNKQQQPYNISQNATSKQQPLCKISQNSTNKKQPLYKFFQNFPGESSDEKRARTDSSRNSPDDDDDSEKEQREGSKEKENESDPVSNSSNVFFVNAEQALKLVRPYRSKLECLTLSATSNRG